MIKIYDTSEIEIADILSRERTERAAQTESTVSNIIADVRARGDDALKDYALKFDKVQVQNLEVTDDEIQNALGKVDSRFISVLEKAKENITDYHKHQVRSSFVISEREGVVLGQKVIPMHRVGLYVPGGTAAYPSSVLMNCLPAKIAGVDEIVMTTPPAKDGGVNPVIVAAAKIAGVDKIYKTGGAQAIAALAYGTQTIPAVEKIVGPGNAFVAEAKRQVYGVVGIDMIAGPSEILVIADGTNDPAHVAADMLSQAEHDKLATAVLITDSAQLAQSVAQEIERQLKVLPREEIARPSIENNGKIIITADIASAVETANLIAPEHLEICVDSPFDYLGMVRNAGSVFLGKNCPEALGDYMAGTNHTLPTSGTARFSSPLSVDDFVKKTAFTYYTADALSDIAEDIEYFAHKEGLDGHARSVHCRNSNYQ